jgi:hypothetical protein
MGLFVILLGIVVFIIGLKGAQHNIIAEFKAAGSAAK